jgi:hypothetical protein
MCGVVGLAVDLGWSYFARRNAQRAADAGALAAVQEFARSAGLKSVYTSCPAGSCVSDYACTSGIASVTANVDSGCIYMRGATISPNNWYGFVDGSNGGRAQGARLDSGLGNVTVFNAANPAGVQIKAGYWVTARVWEDIPQLFSAVLGHPTGRVAARATGAVVEVPYTAALWGNDRRFDKPSDPGAGPTAKIGQGQDLVLGGNGTVTVPGGSTVNLASNAFQYDGATYSGQSGKTVTASTYYQTGGATQNFSNAQARPDGSMFTDPMRGRPSPPAPPAGSLTPCPIDVSQGIPKNANLGPGIYYPVDSSGNLVAATIPFNGNANFYAGGSCLNGTPTAGNAGFGDYVFMGGLNLAKNTYQFEPGRYVLAGAPNTSTGDASAVLSFTQNPNVVDFTPLNQTTNANAGELFILTDYKYVYSNNLPGLPASVTSSPELQKFKQGYTDLQGGSGDISLHGLNPNNATVQAKGLDNYGQILLWQDRRNSTVEYSSEDPANPNPTNDGHISCGDFNNDFACDNTDWQQDGVDKSSQPMSPVMRMQGSPKFKLYGVLYQPRGGLYFSNGGGSVQGYFQVITGAALLWGNSSFLSLGSPQYPLTRLVPTLVQ